VMDGPTVAEFVDWLSLNPHIIDKLSAEQLQSLMTVLASMLNCGAVCFAPARSKSAEEAVSPVPQRAIVRSSITSCQ
jgi:hypothetical protein